MIYKYESICIIIYVYDFYEILTNLVNHARDHWNLAHLVKFQNSLIM